MKFKNNGKVVAVTNKGGLLPEGDYRAQILSVEWQEKVKSKYGETSCIRFTYELQDENGTTHFEKKDAIWYNEGETSRCVRFLNAFYGGNLPEEIELQDWVGRFCWVRIKHNHTEGKTYDNIEAWDFFDSEEAEEDWKDYAVSDIEFDEEEEDEK